MSLRVSVLGSGSGGNCTLVATGRTRLLVDAGFSRREIVKRLAAIGESIEAVDAILISHEHSDHVSGLPSLARKWTSPVFVTAITRDNLLFEEDAPLPPFEFFRPGHRFTIGDIEVDAFTIPHDAADPVGFAFSAHGLRAAVCTDLGYVPESVKRQLHGCQILVLESNHDLEMLKVGPYPWHIKQRVMSRTGHLSNLAFADYVEQELDSETQVLVLAHLSENNNHPAIARISAEQALRARGATPRLVLADQRQPTGVFRF